MLEVVFTLCKQFFEQGKHIEEKNTHYIITRVIMIMELVLVVFNSYLRPHLNMFALTVVLLTVN